MKKLILMLVLASLLLTAGQAAAEEATEYAGHWVTVSLESLEEQELQFPVPSQWGMELPELILNADGTVQWVQGEERQDGTWAYDEETGEIRLTVSGSQESGDLVLKEKKGRLLFEKKFDWLGQSRITFAREESRNLAGNWKPVVQTYGDGEYWAPYPGAGTLVFTEKGNGTYTEYAGTDFESGADFRWQQVGNDIILSVQAENEAGETGDYPFEFFQLEQGLLKRYDSHNGEEYIELLYGKEDERPEFTDVTTIRPLLNTAWQLVAMDIRGVRVPLSMLGIKTEEYLMFFTKGNGGIIHIDGKDQNQVKTTCRIQDGTLTLQIKGQEPIACQWADGEYITREAAEGQKLYYQRKWIPEAQGMAEGEQAPIDLILTKDNGDTLLAGQSLQMRASFADPETVNAKKGNDGILWFVSDPEGNEIPGVTIGEDGLLTADKDVGVPAEALVTVRSIAYGTEANQTVQITTAP